MVSQSLHWRHLEACYGFLMALLLAFASPTCVMVRTRAESSAMDKVPSNLISYLDQRFDQLLSNLAE